MRICTKCSIALHLLVLLAVFDDKKLTSEALAQSTGCNPVMVRGILGDLKRAGLVDIRRGPGGAALRRAPDEITAWQVYRAVSPTPPAELMGLHPRPAAACPVGRNIHALLGEPYGEVAASMEQALSGYTLARLVEGYHDRIEAERSPTGAPAPLE